MRFYLIGAGFIARTHMETIRKLRLDHYEVKVTDSNPNVAAQFLASYPEANGYADARAMLADRPLADDLVVVCTPPSTHYALASMALESGRNVLCEKPLATAAEHARELLKTARAGGLYIGCCSNRFLHTRKFREINRILAEGEIGSPYKITMIHRANRSRSGIEYQPQSRWFLDRSIAGGGILLDWGPYDFAVLNEWLKPVRVEVHGAWIGQPKTGADPAGVTNDVETHAGAMIRYVTADGRRIWLHYERASCTHGEPYSHTEIEGIEGSVRWDTYYAGGRVTVVKDAGGEPISASNDYADPSFDPMETPVRAFADLLLSKDKRALVNEDAVFNFLCLQAIYDCADTGQKQVIERSGLNDN